MQVRVQQIGQYILPFPYLAYGNFIDTLLFIHPLLLETWCIICCTVQACLKIVAVLPWPLKCSDYKDSSSLEKYSIPYEFLVLLLSFDSLINNAQMYKCNHKIKIDIKKKVCQLIFESKARVRISLKFVNQSALANDYDIEPANTE